MKTSTRLVLCSVLLGIALIPPAVSFAAESAPIAALQQTARSSPSAAARLNALWLLKQAGQLPPALLAASLDDTDAAVRKNALQIVNELGASADPSLLPKVIARTSDSDARVRLDAIIALGAFTPNAEVAKTIVKLWPALEDKYEQSVAVGVAARDPVLFIETALAAGQGAAHEGLIRHAVRQLAQKGDANQAARLVTVLAAAPTDADGQKQIALEALTAEWKGSAAPTWNASLQTALTTLLQSPNAAVSGAALPLVARWDSAGTMKSAVQPQIARLLQQLSDPSLSDATRGQVAVSLIGVRQFDPAILPAVGRALADASPAVQKRIVEALGNAGDATTAPALVAAYPRLSGSVADTAFTQILKRADASTAFVNALQKGDVNWRTLGPANIYRLRSHPDKNVATLAAQVFDQLRGPEAQEKEKLILALLPAVEKPGDVVKGKPLFEAQCAVCHTFKGAGRAVAPDLTGMGVHGPRELLTHILDPNRVVEANYVSVDIETTDGESYSGIVARENRNTVTLRNNVNDTDIPVAKIKKRTNTGRSLMPEGFEALGAEPLRDLLAYLSADDNKYRIIDLSTAFSAASTQGIFATRESKNESVLFSKFGLVKADGIPFEVVHPSRTASGQNLLVLKGRNGLARGYPQKVEVTVPPIKASRLHFLGGIAGWGWPFGGEDQISPAAKVTVLHADGMTESWTLANGIHFVDYINAGLEAPGSKKVAGIVNGGQVRLFSKALRGKAPITQLTFESFNTPVAPVFVGVTAELGEGGQYADATVGRPDVKPVPSALAGKFSKDDGVIGIAVTGGGSSHDFARWWGQAETATLNLLPGVKAVYTENPNDLADVFDALDVLYLSHNKAMPNPAVRQGILDFVNAGKGVIISHAGNWYNWPDWPEYNRQLVSGGARGHDRFGEFEVTVTQPDHPVMKGVPATFKIADELYYFMPDPQGAEREVLATAKSPIDGRVFPVVWVTKNPKARIVCVTLGHDGKAHNLEAYKTLIGNSIKWVAEKR